MSTRIDFRDTLVELVKEMKVFSNENILLYRKDRVDATPAVSVTLGKMTSEHDGMSEDDCQSVTRQISCAVDFYLDEAAGNDADAVMDGWLTQFEKLVLKAAEEGRFSDRDVQLDEAIFNPTETSRERRGDLVTLWSLEVYENVEL